MIFNNIIIFLHYVIEIEETSERFALGFQSNLAKLNKNSRFEEEFEDYNDHLPQFLKVGLAPRTAPDYPHKLRKQYKAMFGGVEISPPKRQQSLSSNSELNSGI